MTVHVELRCWWVDGRRHVHYRPFLVGALSFLIPLILHSNSRTKSCEEGNAVSETLPLLSSRDDRPQSPFQWDCNEHGICADTLSRDFKVCVWVWVGVYWRSDTCESCDLEGVKLGLSRRWEIMGFVSTTSKTHFRETLPLFSVTMLKPPQNISD